MYMHKLEGLLREKKITRTAACDYLGITQPTFLKYIRTGGFTLKQAAELGELLDVRDPREFVSIFFEKAVN